MSAAHVVLLAVAGIALLAWFAWLQRRVFIELKANQQTHSDRMSLIHAIRKANLPDEQHLQFHKLFEAVAYTEHYREILAGRDPWALYDARLTALAGKVSA